MPFGPPMARCRAVVAELGGLWAPGQCGAPEASGTGYIKQQLDR